MDDLLEVAVEGRRYRIEPVRRAQEIFQILTRCEVFDPERDDAQLLVHRALDLAQNLRRGVGMGRHHQYHQVDLFDRLDDRRAPFHAGQDVARRYPASDARGFEPRANRVGNRFVLRRVTDEDVVRHRGCKFCHYRVKMRTPYARRLKSTAAESIPLASAWPGMADARYTPLQLTAVPAASRS